MQMHHFSKAGIGKTLSPGIEHVRQGTYGCIHLVRDAVDQMLFSELPALFLLTGV